MQTTEYEPIGPAHVQETRSCCPRREKRGLCLRRPWELTVIGCGIAAALVIPIVSIFGILGLLRETQTPTSHKVLILGFDGLKASVLQAAFESGHAPNLHRLLSAGVGATVRTHSGNRFGSTPPSTMSNYSSPFQWVTGPGWCSVITGVDNSKHLVRGNSVGEINPFAETSKRFPTIFAHAKQVGLRTAASGDYGFLSSISPSGECLPGVVDFECGDSAYLHCETTTSCNLDYRQSLPETADEDNKTAKFAADHIRRASADAIFAHFVSIDVVGHRYGWGSQEQFTAISLVDALIGTILHELTWRAEPWLIIATADHGGLGLTHGTNWNDDEFVPLIVNTKNWDGTLRNMTEPAFHFDVAPTVLKWIGVKISPELDGVAQGI